MIDLTSLRRRFPALAVSTALLATLHAATPKAWFKADSLTGSEGSAVGLWADSSRNGHLAQADTAPTLDLNALNGMPVVHFNGSQSMVFPRPVQDDFTIMVLFRSSQGTGSSDNFYDGSGFVSGEAPGFVNDFGTSLKSSGRVLAGTGNPDRHMRSDFGFNDGNPHIFTFTRTRSNGAIRLYVDRVLHDSDTGGTQSLNLPAQLAIGAQPGPTKFLVGDIAEIIVSEGALTPAEQLEQEDALRGKYGLANGTAPATPSSISANGTRVSWSESIGSKTYQVYRSDSENGSYTLIAEDLVASEFTDPSPLPGGSNFYKVQAVNDVGSSSLSGAAEGISLPLPTNGPVVINEIHYNGLNNAVHSDFVELFNFSDSPRDISGWSLSGGIDFAFPAATVIPAGGHLVIAQDPATIQTLWGTAALGPYSKSLSSDGETIRLRDAAQSVIAEVSYSSGFPWPCAANGNGASAELVNPTLDPTLGSSWRSSVTPSGSLSGEVASPGVQNHQLALNPAPNIEEVSHSPEQPTSSDPVTVTVRPSDPDGLTSVVLTYQTVNPGSHIPAYLPLPISGGQIDTSQPRPANPLFEHPGAWTTLAMLDDGSNGDAVPGDGIFTAVIPAKAHRTLMRYRVTATDALGASVRAPFADDESKNFAYFVYNGVPDYQGIPSATLTSLPTYHFLTRKVDYDQCVAYNSSDQLAGNSPGWTFENWEATLVFNGKVYDHIKYRLHGGNGRYYFTTKRAFRFFFNEGYDFQNIDNDGEPYPTKWNSLTTENGWENRGTLTYSLNEMVNFYLWRKVGIPAPRSNWGHFRTITTAAEQADAHHGDFWGLIFIHEDYDRRFLDSHEMDKGNLYKLTRDAVDGTSQQRYQAPDGVADGSDHYNIYANLTTGKDDAFVNRYVNVERWSTYHAVCQAVRHYDYWPTGDNNSAYYFEPDFTGQTDNLGKLWVLPNDVDATWGPTWNEGKDRVWSTIFDNPANPAFYPVYFNSVREVRDLLWQPDQIDPVIDRFAAIISPFIAADSARWKNAPSDAGNYNGIGGAGYTSLANLVTDMKNFAWTGGSWPGGSVGAGGRAAFMDTLQLGVSNSEGSTMPNTPVISYQGGAGYPVNELTFGTTNFSDPQGGGFDAIQWRVARVTDPSAPAYDPTEKFQIEWDAEFDSGPLDTFAGSFTLPGNACRPGHAYRARVRHRDNTGRWSHWSLPLQFIAIESTEPMPVVISELLYKPTDPTAAEIAAGHIDKDLFEFLELRNVGGDAVDLSGAYFDKGLTYVFPGGSILQPGETILLVVDPAAFAFRYGPGRPVSGTYTGNLSNSGERILLLSATGVPIIDFTYDDAAPWPAEADTAGHSLVLIDAGSQPDPTLPESWRASTRPDGAPGAVDEFTYATWALALGVTGAENEDDDSDGLENSLEYALTTDPHAFSTSPGGEIQTLNVAGLDGDYLTTTFRRLIDATDLTYQVQYSTDSDDWGQPAMMVGEIDHLDGTVTQTWRTPTSVGGERGFLRIRVTLP